MAKIEPTGEVEVRRIVERLFGKEEAEKLPQQGKKLSVKELKKGTWIEKSLICISEVLLQIKKAFSRNKSIYFSFYEKDGRLLAIANEAELVLLEVETNYDSMSFKVVDNVPNKTSKTLFFVIPLLFLAFLVLCFLCISHFRSKLREK